MFTMIFYKFLLAVVAVHGALAATGSQIVERARSYIGVPYVLGGNGYDGIDCSGLTQQSYAYYGINIPRIADDQSWRGTPVNGINNAQPGDLIFYCDSNGYAYHVTLYAGNNRVIHAPQPGEYVREQNYWSQDVCRIRRFVDCTNSPIVNTGSKKWLPQVSGYNRYDDNNGYAGIFGKSITSLRVSGGKAYRVHVKGGKWLPAVTGNNSNDSNNGYAGTTGGSEIDGVAISGGVQYAVHIKGGNWLPAVSGYNINDDDNGYAGILGRPIDAIMIKGRTYATSYNA